MIDDARKLHPGTELEADLCVIGGGAAGIAVAHQLAGSDVKVLVLESGGEQPSAQTQALYDGTSDGLPYYKLDEARLRYLGGSTNHWGRLCRPFDAHDLAHKSWVPRSGWPFGVSDLAPYYQRAHTFLGLATDQFRASTWAEQDSFAPVDFGKDPRMMTRVAQLVSIGPRSLGVRYRDELATTSNLTVLLHANVTDLEVDRAGTTVTRATVSVLSGPTFTVRARRFVLATGGLENPRLLLASRGRFAEGLGNRYDNVGRYFLEHPRFVGGTFVPTGTPKFRFYEAHNVGRSRLEAYLAPTSDWQRREQTVDVQMRFGPVFGAQFQKAIDSNDADQLRGAVRSARSLQVGRLASQVASVASDLLTAPRYLLPGAPLPVPHPDVLAELALGDEEQREALLPALAGNIGAVVYREATGRAPVRLVQVFTRIDPVPDPDSRVTLIDERDALGMPKINLHWQLGRLDRHSAARSLDLLVREFGRLGLGRIRVLEHDSEWPADLEGGWHHMGTTRMNPDPKQGVVDSDCKVHGLSNLYVAGSSVFPTSGSGTPTMLIVALAMRLTDHLKKAL